MDDIYPHEQGSLHSISPSSFIRILDEVQENLASEMDGYHNPKNIVNDEIRDQMSRSFIQLERRIDPRLETLSDSDGGGESADDEREREPSYSTLRTVLQKKGGTTKLFPPELPARPFPVHSEGYLDSLLESFSLPTKKTKNLKRRIKKLGTNCNCHFETVDIALCIAFFLLIIIGFILFIFL